MVIKRARSEATLVLKGIRLRLLLAHAIASVLPDATASTLRAAAYRWTGMRIGPRVSFTSGLTVTGSGSNPCKRLSIGEGTVLFSNVRIDLEGPVTIGKNVFVSHFVRIYTSKHAIGGPSQRFTPAFAAEPVVIGDGAWVGTGAVILPGVCVGAGSVVSAGAYVSRDVPPNTMVAGVPAKVVKDLTDSPD